MSKIKFKDKETGKEVRDHEGDHANLYYTVGSNGVVILIVESSYDVHFQEEEGIHWEVVDE